MSTRTRFPALFVTVLANAASAHNHLTVDTVSGNPGDRIIIRAGYYPTEPEYSIHEEQLDYCEQPQMYSVTSPLTQAGPLNGWHAGFDLLLTSDFYYSTGRLDGGHYRWEIVDVAAISGGPAVLAWGRFTASGFAASARSDAADRLGRSFDTQVAAHDHAQGYAFSSPGVYEITLVAWDSNGRYADSSPVKVRFRIGELCSPDFDGSGFIDTDDFDAFVASFTLGERCADIDGSGFVDTDDFDAFVRAFEDGC